MDKEGFPRSDIDVVEIRTMRNRRACLQTDLRELMKQIEAGLHELHAVYMEIPSEEDDQGVAPRSKEPVSTT